MGVNESSVNAYFAIYQLYEEQEQLETGCKAL